MATIPTFDNELEDIQPSRSSKQATQESTTQQCAPVAAPANDGFDWNSNEAEEFGKDTGLPAVKVEQGKAVRVALVPGHKVLHANTHYKDGSGTFQCLGTENAICCAKAGKAKDRFVALVFTYDNANSVDGKLDLKTVPVVSVKALRMSRTNFRDIRNLPLEDATVFDCDFKIVKDTNGIAHKISVISRTPRWRQVEQQAVELAGKYDRESLARKLGKKVTKSEVALMYADVSDADEARLGDIEDV